ncbi:hypothetical protein BDU57DRAFT_504426 [Ampelomyces quisqualis]|uniref:Uncharacterized protein n=1 Tax=Ampelomyces quisqualis TaxID=50730 RepID=A0A6A5QCJ8_AMPQU|nr:hypothetical protein BDU57DRAFT_504426 [Ampelomyces quisqualis]
MSSTKPTLASNASAASITSLRSSLSFCLPTSLSFLTSPIWQQTPWVPRLSPTLHPSSPITPADADTISAYLSHAISSTAIQHALLFCTSPSHGPDLFVVFPHTTTPPATHEPFLRTWHDQIVKPAFDRSWRDSHLTRVHGAENDSSTRILAPNGVSTSHDALRAAGFVARLRRGAEGSVAAAWPASSVVLDEAWDAVTGMLRNHPDLTPEFQDPVLLAVYRAEILFAEDLDGRDVYASVGREWDKYVDAGRVVEGSFGVVIQAVMGVGVEEVEDGGVGREFKRTAENGEGDGGEAVDGHRAKRRKAE